jgi:transcriptional regulator with XRE-family HTH domain
MQMRAGKKALQEMGAKLKKLRQHLGLTRQQMAAHFKVTRTAYYKNENGVSFPSLPSLRALCLGFDVSMDWLLFDKGPMISKKKEPPPEPPKKPQPEITPKEEKTPDKEIVVEKKKELEPEVEELVAHMESIPLLHHKILTEFQQFKMDHPELVKSVSKQQ